MKLISFRVEALPAGYDRDAAAHGYTPAAVTAWRDAVRVCYVEAAPFDFRSGEHLGLVHIAIEVYGSRADADNLAKEVMDALKGFAYRDDGQVNGLCVGIPCRQIGPKGGVKKPLEEPGAEVLVVLVGA